MKDIDFDVFRLLLEYLYTGEVVVPPRLAAQLLLAAERYMVYSLQVPLTATRGRMLTFP